MKMLLVYFMAMVLFCSCVSRAKYEGVVSSIASKEKQQKKLEKQILELRQNNAKLRDSVERIGG